VTGDTEPLRNLGSGAVRRRRKAGTMDPVDPPVKPTTINLGVEP
jgi:hypothetical protein